ncbi:MAG TPA: FAD-dependent monooxygenase, partial [Ktedonobacteraceae bacterium]|nr:FAD-dependent monooxygenase [Ktedonobacteraceae bacterium]
MKILILGGGPAGLYCGLLIKKAHPAHDITIIERNASNVTYGWGVVFSDRTLGSFQRADYPTYEQISDQFVIWDAIDVKYRGEVIHSGGHVIASISRKLLLHILQARCRQLGISMKFGCEVQDLPQPGEYDLLIAADGINSVVRKTYTSIFKPKLELGKARYIWLGAQKVLDAFTFIFRENEHGLFQVHAYPFSGTTSTFIIECDETSWLNAGLDKASEAESLAYCEQLLADDLAGVRLLSNNSKWIHFPTLKTRTWHHQRIVLLGDAAHTAHFSIGSGTKLAMEDAIALASALEQHADLETALNEYELERKPVVELFQQAAQESQHYFETIKRHLGLPPMQFAFHLLTRSGRISYDDLRLRDARFGDAVDRWYAHQASISITGISAPPTIVAPAPLFAPLRLRATTLPNRVVLSRNAEHIPVQDGMPTEEYASHITILAQNGAGLLLTVPVAISSTGRITPECAGLYHPDHVAAWSRIVTSVHTSTLAKIGLLLNHAGRRGSTRPRTAGLDRPLRQGNWSLVAPSPLPYTPQSQVPCPLERSDMDNIRDDFVRAARMAQEADFDLLQLHFAHGYLLASFLSPLSNQRRDEYGGSLEHRVRFPLEVFDAVRAIWPEHKPLSVA